MKQRRATRTAWGRRISRAAWTQVQKARSTIRGGLRWRWFDSKRRPWIVCSTLRCQERTRLFGNDTLHVLACRWPKFGILADDWTVRRMETGGGVVVLLLCPEFTVKYK